VGLKPSDIDHVAVGRRPLAHLHRKLLFALRRRPSAAEIGNRLANMTRMASLGQELAKCLDVDPATIGARIHGVEHHRAHMASSWWLSPFDSAACLTVDGSGDFVTMMFGHGNGDRVIIEDRVPFPHSLGLFYTACTQYLGFGRFGDEYKVMGLAAYGEPEYLEDLRRIVELRAGGKFRLDLSWFRHHKQGLQMQWEAGAPEIAPIYGDAWIRRFGPARHEDAPLEDRHKNLARSVQAVTEEVYLHALRHLYGRHRSRHLCLAGGCAYNSVANGRVLASLPYDELHVHPAAGDAGTAVGAALSVWHETLRNHRTHTLEHPFLGPGYSDGRIREALEARRIRFEWIDDGAIVALKTAERLAAGEVIGWFQGRGEWGPRALGNRSILADPRRSETRDVLNARVKRRESFRPFAPSVLEERCGDYFERSDPSPYMLQVYATRGERRREIPAVVHVDGTARVQTVNRAAHPLFHRLIDAFGQRTGTPVLLNTSFNENEPIVNTPEEAIDCFLRTRMDGLVIGNAVVSRDGQSAELLQGRRRLE
jgi:carbamoyltransferase